MSFVDRSQAGGELDLRRLLHARDVSVPERERERTTDAARARHVRLDSVLTDEKVVRPVVTELAAGLDFVPLARVRIDERSHDDARGLCGGHDVTSHRPTVLPFASMSVPE